MSMEKIGDILTGMGVGLDASTVSQITNEPECSMPQLALIKTLHRHKDGYVTFSVGSGDDFHNRVAIRAGQLETYFPEFVSELLKDSYVSINADFRLAKLHWRDGKRTTAYGYPKHSTDSLKYLCACYVDIDYYRLNTDFGTVLGHVVNYQDNGIIPPPSIIVRSGRGIWLLWLLTDHKDPDRSQGAFPEKIGLYAKIQKVIGARLAQLGADLGAQDAARHIRIPGSLHTGSERHVEWWIQGAAASIYTLPQLAQFFGVEVHKLNRRVRRVFHEDGKQHKSRGKRRGWEALNARRLREFVQLKAMRGGGFEITCRNHAALIYAWLLRCNSWSRGDATHEVMRMASECHPRLTAAECRGALQTGFGRRMRKMTDQTIAD
jgi:hypothetical protein